MLESAALRPGTTRTRTDEWDGQRLGLYELLDVLRPTWMDHGLCGQYPEVDFFPSVGGNAMDPALAICGSCPVRVECLAYALDDPDVHGVWGGTGMRERARIRAARKSAA